jgi:hypothetical protein
MEVSDVHLQLLEGWEALVQVQGNTLKRPKCDSSEVVFDALTEGFINCPKSINSAPGRKVRQNHSQRVTIEQNVLKWTVTELALLTQRQQFTLYLLPYGVLQAEDHHTEMGP